MASGGRGLIAAIVLVAVVLLASWALSLQAQNAASPAGGAVQAAASRFTLMSSPLGEKRAGVFILDSQTMRLLVYAVEGEARTLRLVAVRDISQDLRLSHYNNERPWPEQIRQQVEGGQEGELK